MAGFPTDWVVLQIRSGLHPVVVVLLKVRTLAFAANPLREVIDFGVGFEHLRTEGRTEQNGDSPRGKGRLDHVDPVGRDIDSASLETELTGLHEGQVSVLMGKVAGACANWIVCARLQPSRQLGSDIAILKTGRIEPHASTQHDSTLDCSEVDRRLASSRVDGGASWARVPGGFQVLVASSEQLGLIAGEAVLDCVCSKVDVLASDHDGRIAELGTQRSDIANSLGFGGHLRSVGGKIQGATSGQIGRGGRSSSGRRLGHVWIHWFVGVGGRSVRRLRTRTSVRAGRVRRGFEALGVGDLQGGSGLGRKSRRIESKRGAIVFKGFHV